MIWLPCRARLTVDRALQLISRVFELARDFFLVRQFVHFPHRQGVPLEPPHAYLLQRALPLPWQFPRCARLPPFGAPVPTAANLAALSAVLARTASKLRRSLSVLFEIGSVCPGV